MVGRTQYRTNKAQAPPRRYYICTERKHAGLCQLPMVPADSLEDAILTALETIYEEASLSTHSTAQQDGSSLHRQLQEDLEKLSAHRQRWRSGYEEGFVRAGELRAQLDRLEAEETRLQRELAALGVDRNRGEQKSTQEPPNSLKSIWSAATACERKELIQTIVDRIAVMPDLLVTMHFK